MVNLLGDDSAILVDVAWLSAFVEDGTASAHYIPLFLDPGLMVRLLIPVAALGFYTSHSYLTIHFLFVLLLAS